MRQNSCRARATENTTLEQQIAQLYGSAAKERIIPVTAVPVQQQTGETDCGLFSVAAAVHIASGDIGLTTTFTQETMKHHLLQCFTQQKISPFPAAPSATKIKRNKVKHLFVTQYCSCAMPESFDTNMIQCDKCAEWFHFKCVGLSKNRNPRTWSCSTCK